MDTEVLEERMKIMLNDMKILIVEDDVSISDILAYSLKKEGYGIKCAFNGKEAFEYMENFMPNLIILDLMLPDISGFDICKVVSVKYKIPVLMLTARNNIEDKILGLEIGADDYITKPFDIREVKARVRVALRRVEDMKNNFAKDFNDKRYIYVNPYVKIDTMSRIVYKNDIEVEMKPKEFDLLIAFCENKNMVFTRDQLLDMVWDIDYEGGLRTVDVHIQRLRKKLDDNLGQSIIETVFGVGYKMRCSS